VLLVLLLTGSKPPSSRPSWPQIWIGAVGSTMGGTCIDVWHTAWNSTNRSCSRRSGIGVLQAGVALAAHQVVQGSQGFLHGVTPTVAGHAR